MEGEDDDEEQFDPYKPLNGTHSPDEEYEPASSSSSFASLLRCPSVFASVGLLCGLITALGLFIFFVLTSASLSRHRTALQLRHLASQVSVPPIDPLYAELGMRWDAACTANDSVIMAERCACLGVLEQLSSTRNHTCTLPPPVLLSHYFQPVVEYYPNVLTYRPSIDCQHGRYLLVDEFWNDGMGMSIASYNALLSLATHYHLTLVGVPFRGTHIPYGQDPTTVDQMRRAKIKYFEWEVPRSQWERCSNDTPVAANVLHFDNFKAEEAYKMRENAGFLYDPEKPFGKVQPVVAAAFRDNTGLTLRVRNWNGHIGCVHRTSFIHAIRAAVDPIRTLQRIPEGLPRPPYIEVGFHLRRGDLGHWNATLGEYEAQRKWHFRVLTSGAWARFITELFSVVPWSIASRMRWTLFTEGNASMHQEVVHAIEDGSAGSFLRAATSTALQYHKPPIRFADEDMETIDAITYLAQSDILLLSPSDFSYASCYFNTQALKMGIGYGVQFHGCHNHIRLSYTRVEGLPDEWKDAEYLPESVFTHRQRITFFSIANFTERLLDTVQQLDDKRDKGLYPYDQQPPGFLSEHRSFVAEQLDSDRAMGFVGEAMERRAQQLWKWLDEHSARKEFDNLWYYNHIFY